MEKINILTLQFSLRQIIPALQGQKIIEFAFPLSSHQDTSNLSYSNSKNYCNRSIKEKLRWNS